MKRPSPLYRPDIDGLRAIAVLSVVAFHAFPGLMPGGFSGVDVFFVISGFLIGGIIIGGVEDGTFSFADFYARRIRRIFPSLMIVLACCLAFGWRVLLASEYKALSEQAAAGALFFSNVLLWLRTGYFDADASLKPLLHLWSLGVEEQFYIVWPPILLICYRLRWNAGIVALTIGIISFALNVHMVRVDAAGAFFLPHTRMWEPLSGSLLAYAVRRAKQGGVLPNEYRIGSHAMAAIGAALITIGLVDLNASMLFPGWWALLPTTGTALVIGAGPGAFVNRILSCRPLVWIGLISYPLYLWHWPLLSFAKICEGHEPSIGERAVLVAVSFVLAALTYWLVEKNVRHRKGIVTPVALGAAMFCVASASYAMYRENGFPSRFQRLEQIESAVGQWDYPGKDMTEADVDGVRLLSRRSKHTGHVLFFGDSNMEMYWPRADQLISKEPDRARSVTFATYGGCPPIPGTSEPRHPLCTGWADKVSAYANAHDFDTIVIAADWIGYFALEKTYVIGHGDAGRVTSTNEGTKQAIASLRSMMSSFRDHGKQVVLILSIPNSYMLNTRSLVKRSLSGFTVAQGGVARSAFDNEYGDARKQLIDAARASGATVIDPMDSLCPSGFCRAWFGEDAKPIYKDGDHLSAAYVRKNATFIDQTILMN